MQILRLHMYNLYVQTKIHIRIMDLAAIFWIFIHYGKQIIWSNIRLGFIPKNVLYLKVAISFTS